MEQGIQDYEILGYDEPAVKAEEFWYYSTIRDAGELIRVHGAKSFMDDLDKRAKDKLLKEIASGNKTV